VTAFRLSFSEEVEAAQKDRKPIVALESTIITHGMPPPRNAETALAVEEAIRRAGAVPATIAVMDGQVRVGLAAADLKRLGAMKEVAKLSRADLAACVASGGSGATTVAATMIIARVAGIEVFATGGVGGVHRGASESFDVSADLNELSQTPVSVVAAGAKAFLDLSATLEVLETLGVPVITVGQDAFPAFWSRDSGLPSPIRFDDVAAIARSHVLRQALGMPGGQLVANPIPIDDEISASELEPLIARATDEARSRQIAAKEVTPFLLSRIFDLTAGRSLEANIALVLNNSRLGARLAIEIAKLRYEQEPATA
jgi:pseudouridine-5'-phosphate glycosidase